MIKFSEHWLQWSFRPMMAYSYMVVCIWDFMFAQIALIVFSFLTGTPLVIWHPITLEGGGFFHLAMGSIITATAWKRGEEKLKFLEATKEKLNATNATINSVIK